MGEVSVTEEDGDASAAGDHKSDATIWGELNAWGESLADWQRYIVSHAVRDGTLTDERIENAYRLFLRDKELDSGEGELPELLESITGRDAVEGKPLTIQAVKSLRHVNAIPETSHLTFGPELTVIYGHNGTGKSGFARLLSSACFSRATPQILGNIYDDEASDSPATAQFVLDRGDGPDEVTFTDGEQHHELKRISIFDSSVARIHLAEENELGFQPAGFDVFDEAIRAIGLITQKLETDIRAKVRPNKFDQLFTDPGPVADQVGAVNSETDVAGLRALAVFGAAEKERLEEVTRQEKELHVKSPVETLKALATAKSDINVLQTKIQDLEAKLGEAAREKGRGLLDTHRKTLSEAIKAGSEIVSHPKLGQTGSTEWDNFILASRTLGQAEKEVYPTEGDPCLLCHRPLDAPSATLITRMWGYLDHVARSAAITADEQLNSYCAQLRLRTLKGILKRPRV